MLYAIKEATYKLVYNDVKNLEQILICCKCIQCLQWKIQNVYLWEIITFDLFSYKSTKCYIRINKQLINLVYNDMKNLTYSLICINCVQSVFWNIDRKDLSVWDNHIDSVFTTTRKCLLWINKQLINLDYDDMKNLARILSCCKCIQGLQWKIQNVYLWEIIILQLHQMLYASKQATY